VWEASDHEAGKIPENSPRKPKAQRHKPKHSPGQIAGAHYLPSLAATLALSRNNLIMIRNVMMRVILLRGLKPPTRMTTCINIIYVMILHLQQKIIG